MYSRNTSGKTDIGRGEFKSYGEKLPPGYTGSRFSRIKENAADTPDSSAMRERGGMQGTSRTARRNDFGERNAAIRRYEDSLPSYKTDSVRKYERSGAVGSDSFMKAQRELEDRAHEMAVISEELLHKREESDDKGDEIPITDTCRDESDRCDKSEDSVTKCDNKPTSNVLQTLSELFKNESGREDMLLCALLLLFLSEKGEDCGDIVIILALLLALH